MKTFRAFTLIELLVVVLILGLLSTLAVGVFTTQVERARYAAARTTIQEMEIALERYHIDLGEYPPSGSKSRPSGWQVPEGCGYLQLALMHSLGGNSQDTSGTLWKGPYISIKTEHLGDFTGTPLEDLATAPDKADVQMLDPWRSPYRFVRSGPAPDKYLNNGGTELPQSHPFYNTERYYNPSTYQIVSKGVNSESEIPPYFGTQKDDITNFGM